MKEQVEKEGEADATAHDKYMCWCETNKKEKTAAIGDGEQHVEDLQAFLDEAAGKESELSEAIELLKSDIAKDKDALATATELRRKANEEFVAEEADTKETIGLLSEAVAVLSKVQLLQHKNTASVEAQQAQVDASEVLVQVREKVQRHRRNFQNVLQRDLFDMLGSFDDVLEESADVGGRSATFLPKRRATAAALQTEGKQAPLEGAAAGAKSYNSKSGRIFGMMQEMAEEMSRDLGDAQKADLAAEADFQRLRAAKLSEIETGTGELERKEQELATLRNKAAEAKEDIEATAAAVQADKKFLVNLEQQCKTEEEDYEVRSKVRGDEIVALSETLKILTEDEARDLFNRAVSFLQLGASTAAESRAAAQDRATSKVLHRLAKAAKRSGDWALATLAVRARLDSFTEVKAALDKMQAELKAQQKQEYAKWEVCKKDIDEAEDAIKVGNDKKEDLAQKHQQLSNALEALRAEIEALRQEEERMQGSLKKAGEQRKAENLIFQSSLSDQHAAINILKKALARLKLFYASLLQVSSQDASTEPGQASSPEPPKPKAYSKSVGATGALGLIEMVIKDAEIEVGDLTAGEQHAQTAYAELVRDVSESIEAARAAAQEKAAQVAEVESEVSETQQAQLANDQQLEKLNDLLRAHHVDCDFLLKYFDVRQKARAEEMDSITDAKAILSGANFPGA